jgi:hypothetical protein
MSEDPKEGAKALALNYEVVSSFTMKGVQTGSFYGTLVSPAAWLLRRQHSWYSHILPRAACAGFIGGGMTRWIRTLGGRSDTTSPGFASSAALAGGGIAAAAVASRSYDELAVWASRAGASESKRMDQWTSIGK